MTNDSRVQRLGRILWSQISELRFGFVTVIHLVLTFFLFSPFLLRGLHIFASTDNVYAYFPHFFLNLRSLKLGDPNFWNPYLASGIDFTTSTHNYILSPFNWVLMLVPEAYFSSAFTLRMLIELWLVGVFGFLAFNAVLNCRKWAFFASVTYQHCSLMFLGMTLYPALTSMMLTTFAVYVLFTLEKRSLHLSYILLVATFTAFFLSSQLAYAPYMGLSIILLYIFFTLTHYKDFRSAAIYWGLFGAAGLTGALIAAIRLLPFYEALRNGSRLLDDIGRLGLRDVTFLHYFAFIPETFGLNLHSSISILSAIDFQGHIHGQASLYFGVIPILLFMWSLVAVRNSRPILTLSVIFLSVWLWLMNVQPVAAAFNLVLFPFIHMLAAIYTLPIGVCLLAGYIGKHLEQNLQLINGPRIATLATIGVVALAGPVMVWLNVFPQLLVDFRVAAMVGLVVILLLSLIFTRNWLRCWPVITLLEIVWLMTSLSLTTAGLIAIWQVMLPAPSLVFLQESSRIFILSAGYLLLSLGAIAGLPGMMTLFLPDARFRNGAAFISGTALLALLAVLIFPFSLFDRPPTTLETFFLFLLGLARFIFIAALFVALLILLKNRILSPKYLMPLLLLVTLADLLPFNKSYSRIVTEPFFEGNLPFPEKEEVLNNIYLPVGYDALVTQDQKLLHKARITHLTNVPEVLAAWTFANGGKAEIQLNTVRSGARPSLVFTNEDDQTSNLFQDIEAPERFAGKILTLGAWIKSSDPDYVQLLLTDISSGRSSDFHSGSGAWEWLETYLRINDPERVRAHVSVIGPGSAQISEIILAEPPADKAFGLDLENYRVNHPHIFLGLAGSEWVTNIPNYYGIRTYGGVNSQFPAGYITFLRNFSDVFQKYVSGIGNDISDQRFLDLIGARYDIDARGQPVVRDTALARLMLYTNFEILEDGQTALTRLKEPTFNPQQTVLLAEDPKLTRSVQPDPARRLSITRQTPSQVEVVVESDQPAILYFGDSYDEGWKAFVNGQEQPVMRANYQFMATTVDTGESRVVFKFVPITFMKARSFTAGGLIIFLLISIFLWRIPLLGTKNKPDPVAKSLNL